MYITVKKYTFTKKQYDEIFHKGIDTIDYSYKKIFYRIRKNLKGNIKYEVSYECTGSLNGEWCEDYKENFELIEVYFKKEEYNQDFEELLNGKN